MSRFNKPNNDMENELFGKNHEQEENGLFGKQHEVETKQLIRGDVINKEPKFINKGIVMICDNCNKEYKEYYDPSKRNMPLCNDCLPF